MTGFLLHRPMSYDELQAEAYRLFCKNLDRTTECFELVDECKDLEEKLSSLVSLNQFLVRQVGELQAELAEWEATRTTGGPAAPSNAPHWTNVAAPPPPSASDESAPPLRRSDTSSSFRGESRG